MRDLTLVLPFFMNSSMLLEHQRIWSDYPPELGAALHVIVVDDCSPKGHRLSRKSVPAVENIASFQLYRLLTKVRWNWLACRNLGVANAVTDWVLLTDMDHALPAETLTALTTMDLDRSHVYRLSRVDAPRVWPYRLDECRPYKVHPNTWLMARDMYDRVGGYDERLAGLYGTDGEMRDRIHATARAVVILPNVLIRYPRDIVADASTLPSVYTRKNDPANDEELLARREARAKIPGWRPLRLTFPYEHQFTIRQGQMEVAC